MALYKILITELAENEFVSAYQYYELQQIGLGLRFEAEIEIIFKHLISNPFIFQRNYKHYREAPLKIFPYFIVYELYGKTVIINSIFHTSRNPKGKLKVRKK